MNRHRTQQPVSGTILAILVGAIGGLVLLTLVYFDFDLGGQKIDRTGRLAILINGLTERVGRDVLLPDHGWVLQVRLPEPLDGDGHEGLVVMLRSERTGATIQIEERFSYENGAATLMIPKSLGLGTGLLSVRATFSDGTGKRFEDSHRIRVRSWFGGSPIGERQIIHFDFGVDHDADGIPDFLKDLELFGLASPGRPELARALAARIEARALQRVEQAYDDRHDPNRTGRPSDPVHVRFSSPPGPGDRITRICVGGSDPTQSRSVGHVRFDLRNQKKSSVECGDEPAAGLFPAELVTYRDSTLYQDVLGPFLRSLGGTPFGELPEDSLRMLDNQKSADRDGPHAGRRADINRAIDIFADVLGTIMAHEAAHALGLVAAGQPGVGLFGGSQDDAYAHNLDPFGNSPTKPWLMNPGRGFRFEELAGEGVAGPLRFRPLNYAYLRDRVVVSDKR